MKRKIIGMSIAAGATLFSAELSAQQVSNMGSDRYYDERLRASKSLAALGEDLFGDRINLQDGTVAFRQTDIRLATNSALSLSIGRKSPSGKQGLDAQFAVFGRDWELDVPYMMATYDTRDGWNVVNPDTTMSLNRCSIGHFIPKVRVGPWPYYYSQAVPQHMYWNGIEINIPARGEERMLEANAAQPMPGDGKTYTGTTKSGWRVSCLATIQNGSGEGFLVLLPDGTKYYFDWMANRNAIDLTDNDQVGVNGEGEDPWHLLALLTDVFLYASKVEDRFGNYVKYTYDPAHPNRITKLESNDGARIDVLYNSAGQIATATTVAAPGNGSSRTWKYTYVVAGSPLPTAEHVRLSEIENPDGSKWTFSGSLKTSRGNLTYGGLTESNFWSDACAANPKDLKSTSPPPQGTTASVVMTHPSGARGEFKFRRLYQGTNNTPGKCMNLDYGPQALHFVSQGVPRAYPADSLYEKRISGPGISDRTWFYMYYPSWSTAESCGSGCAGTSTTTVLTADGVLRTYVYGNDYSRNLGQLISEKTEKNGVTYSVKSYTYVTTASGFPDNTGNISVGHYYTWLDLYGNPFSFKNRPLKSSVIKIDGVSFSNIVNGFDGFVRPTSVTKSSAPSP